MADGQLWRNLAQCRGMDPNFFHPHGAAGVAAARRVCRTCPVRLACLDYALAHGERVGVWGGLSENERRGIRRARLTQAS